VSEMRGTRCSGPCSYSPLCSAIGHCCNTRVRCRIVSRMRGRCLMALSKISRAYRGCCRPTAYGRLCAVLRPLLDLVEVAHVRLDRIVGFSVGKLAHPNPWHQPGLLIQLSRLHYVNGDPEFPDLNRLFCWQQLLNNLGHRPSFRWRTCEPFRIQRILVQIDLRC
jgi:hypothetical protein